MCMHYWLKSYTLQAHSSLALDTYTRWRAREGAYGVLNRPHHLPLDLQATHRSLQNATRPSTNSEVSSSALVLGSPYLDELCAQATRSNIILNQFLRYVRMIPIWLPQRRGVSPQYSCSRQPGRVAFSQRIRHTNGASKPRCVNARVDARSFLVLARWILPPASLVL